MSLNEKSGFNKLLAYYDCNKDKDWNEWLVVQKIFPRPGKQGLVGLMSAKDDDSIVFVFKISQYINHLVQHEFTIMDSLSSVADFCPHFCRVVGAIICKIDPHKRKDGNPFICESKYPIDKEVLLLEYLDNTYKLNNYINSSRVHEKAIFSTIKQTLLAIAIAQQKCNLTHYDLHSNNIMMRRCSKDLVFLYILDDNLQFCIPTHGSYPIIIDYGFSYSHTMNGSPMWSTLNHTDVGFMSDRFDPIADPKLFLVTVADEIEESKKSKNSTKLLNIVKNNYTPLKIDWRSGWDTDNPKCATDYLLDILSQYNSGSTIFKEQEYYCVDLLQTLIVLPLQPQNYTNIGMSFKTFTAEFCKIEKEISSPFYCLYILKSIIDTARGIRSEYTNKDTREQALSYFKLAIYEVIDSVVKYCKPKDIHFEKMLCSLFCLSKCSEGVLYDAMFIRTIQKEKMYSKIPLKSPEELFTVIDINIEDDYTFNERTNIIAIDCTKNTCYPVDISEDQRNLINSYKPISRGIELYKIIDLSRL
jgi:hypothetical protein